MHKILVIEDEEAVRANLVELLDAEGFQVLSAADGQAGVRLAREHLPDVILCDIMMPGLDGYGVLDALRQDAATATLPFIFLTARGDHSDVRQGMNLGADDYLIKPFTRGDLLKALSTRLVKQAAITYKVQAKLDELRGSIALALPHELRTPLTGILGYTEILYEDYASLQPEEIHEMVGRLYVAAQRLYDLVLDFALYAELEVAVRDPAYAEAMLGAETCPVRPAVMDVAAQQAQKAQREGDLSFDLQEVTLQMPGTYLEKAVRELLSNAFKFSQPKTPVHVTGHSDGDYYILSVHDRGRGMTAQQIADIGAYLQFDRKRYEQQGPGLGLTIARRVAELQGGELRIESEPGQRTTASLVLSLKRATVMEHAISWP